MRSRIAALVTALLLIATPAFAGQVWTDADGDGLPDPKISFPVFVSDLVSADIWIDTQSFQFTSFRVNIESSGLDWKAGMYLISGGSNAPIDTVSHPGSMILAGSGYSIHGLVRVGRVTAHVGVCNGGYNFIGPVIDPTDPYRSRLTAGGGSQEFNFQTFSGSAFSDFGDCFGGACCMPDGSCVITIDECACIQIGGDFQGCQSNCTFCPQTATEHESWGRVKSIFR